MFFFCTPSSLYPCLPPLYTDNVKFYRRWRYISHSAAYRHLKLLITECKRKIKTLTKELSQHLELLRNSCSTDAFSFYQAKLDSMALSFESLLAERRAKKTAPIRRFINHNLTDNEQSVRCTSIGDRTLRCLCIMVEGMDKVMMECKNIFQQQLPVVAFRRSPNLRDLLVTAKLPSNSTNPLPQLPSGSFRCGKNCATCPYISDGLTTHTFFSTNETRHIKSNLTCDTKNLIYMIQCNRCNLQYIGETKRRLKDRFNEHRRTINNPKTKSKPTTVAQHFLSSPNHTAYDMQLIPIEKVFSNRDSIRKAREAFLISKGSTIDPEGLNIREETY